MLLHGKVTVEEETTMIASTLMIPSGHESVEIKLIGTDTSFGQKIIGSVEILVELGSVTEMVAIADWLGTGLHKFCTMKSVISNANVDVNEDCCLPTK